MNARVSFSTQGLARACAVHPKRTVAVWGALVLVSFVVIAVLLGSALTSDGDVTSNPESKQAAALIHESFPPEPTPSEIVVVRSDRYTVDEPAFQAKVQALADRSAALGVVADAQSYYASNDQSLVSKDRHATMVPLVMRGDEVAPLVDLVKAENGQDGFQVSITGSLTADADFEKLSEQDLQKGELLIGLPAALIMLLLVFGAVVAGLVPVLLGLLSIVVAVALTALVGQAFEVSFFVVNMISAMGLALGIDYALFILSRYREERGRGLEKIDAIVASGATASRAVLFSGIAFVLAMFGMLLVPDTILRSLALGAILVGIVSVARGADAAARRAEPARRPRQRAADPRDRPPGDHQRRLGGPLLVGARPRRHAASARESRRGDGAPARPRASRARDRHGRLGAEHAARPLPVQAGLRRAEPRLPRRRRSTRRRSSIQGDVSSAPVRSAIEKLEASLADQAAFGAPTQQASDGRRPRPCSRFPSRATPTGQRRRARSATCAPT